MFKNVCLYTYFSTRFGFQDIHGAWDIKFGTGVLPHTAIPEVNAAVSMFAKAGVPLSENSMILEWFYNV